MVSIWQCHCWPLYSDIIQMTHEENVQKIVILRIQRCLCKYSFLQFPSAKLSCNNTEKVQKWKFTPTDCLWFLALEIDQIIFVRWLVHICYELWWDYFGIWWSNEYNLSKKILPSIFKVFLGHRSLWYHFEILVSWLLWKHYKFHSYFMLVFNCS